MKEETRLCRLLFQLVRQFRTIALHAAPRPRSCQLHRRSADFRRLVSDCDHDIKNRNYGPFGVLVPWRANRAVDYPSRFDQSGSGKSPFHRFRRPNGDGRLLVVEADGLRIGGSINSDGRSGSGNALKGARDLGNAQPIRDLGLRKLDG
jgi:hypothetical protein